MNNWVLRPVAFKFQLSDITIFKLFLDLQVRAEALTNNSEPITAPVPPVHELVAGSEGFVVRSLPLAAPMPTISKIGDYLCYMQEQYEHCFIDFQIGYDRYLRKFSSKTRSTINRKLRKYSEHCGGTITWKTYRNPAELTTFFEIARDLSKTTYQERLLGRGLPDNKDYIEKAVRLSEEDKIRAYILFDRDRAVSYLFCPIDNDVVMYGYLGYSPDYMHLSVGTVLQWLVTEQLFREGRFRYFDFTEGQGSHKILFATHQRLCGNVVMVKRTMRNIALVRAHSFMNNLSKNLGETMDRYGLKARVKRLVRFRR